jgi:penicillin-binding protein 1C
MKQSKIIAAGAAIAALAVFYAVFSGFDRSRIESCRILDRNGILLREISSTENGVAYPVDIEALPVYLTKIVVTTEDKRFYTHHGIDPAALARAVMQNIRAKKTVSGGSTITQQLVRNIYNLPRNIWSKAIESVKAVLIETRYSKKDILSEYLNRIPYGNGAFGIEAASRLYFSRPARELTAAQCAFLTAIPGATGVYNPYNNFGGVLKRQKRILARAFAAGVIGKKQFDSALNERISVDAKERRFLAPHFCDYLIKKYGPYLKGEVITTLDSSLQLEVEKIIVNIISRLKNANVNNAAAVVLDNRTGDVLAYAGSADYFNEANSGQINGAAAPRQPGSTVKPFVYGLALESGFTAADILDDMGTHIKANGGGDFYPMNYDKKFHGPVRLRTALACSYNVATVNLAANFGPQLLLDKLRLAGLKSLEKKAVFYGPGLCLGSGEVPLLEIAGAYSSLARGGIVKNVRFLAAEPSVETARVLTPQAAFIVTDILSDNQARVPAFGEFSPLRMPFKCAAKTGTSKDFRDNWAVGYTPRYTVGVWAGNFDRKPMYSISGITGSAPVFRDIILRLEGNNADTEFKVPENIVRVKICAKSGGLPGEYCNETMDEYFIKGFEPVKTCTVHRACAQKDGSMKVYEVYPPEYFEWEKENGIEMAPPGAMASGAVKSASGCRVVYPQDGDVFRLDAVLRKKFQAITLITDAGDGLKRAAWNIDGKQTRAGSYPYRLTYNLEKGGHVIFFSGFGKDGDCMKSSPVRIKVL